MGGCSLQKEIRACVKRGLGEKMTLLVKVVGAAQAHAQRQGMSPFEESAGVVA